MKHLKFYNTPARMVEDFKPQEAGKVKVYSCGPTVYDYLTIGNWATYIRWDLLVRVLASAGYAVEQVINITDVGHLVSDADEGEDKLQTGAKREGKSAWEIAQKYTNAFFVGVRELNLLPALKYPRATEHLAEQISLIKNLESKGFTYTTTDGVYFDTSKFLTYGEFANLHMEGQQEGLRIGVNAEKRNPSDFALWKFSPENQKRDMEWDSPWGKGFPGWHIECSAMAIKYLGETLDIHTGGIDHVPVHHTNEIAQSEAATGKRFSNFWLHSNFLMINGTKISKSLSNGISLDDLKDKGYSLMDYKLFVLQSHYRSESNFTWEGLEAARKRRADLQAFADLRFQPKETDSSVKREGFSKALEEIMDSLYSDLNSPAALASLSVIVDSTQFIGSADINDFDRFISELDNLFGLRLTDSVDVSQEQKQLILDREEARKNQDWAAADSLRHTLISQGIEVKDTEAGPIWSRRA